MKNHKYPFSLKYLFINIFKRIYRYFDRAYRYKTFKKSEQVRLKNKRKNLKRKNFLKKNKTLSLRHRATTKKKVLIHREGNICKSCLNRFPKEQLTVDHIIPVSKGGSSRKENLQLLCKKCNEEKADKVFVHSSDGTVLKSYPLFKEAFERKGLL